MKPTRLNGGKLLNQAKAKMTSIGKKVVPDQEEVIAVAKRFSVYSKPEIDQVRKSVSIQSSEMETNKTWAKPPSDRLDEDCLKVFEKYLVKRSFGRL